MTGEQACLAAYRERFGREAKWLLQAPGRLNLIGEHVDYNAGLVLPMAIEQSLYLAAGPSTSATCEFASTRADSEVVRFAAVEDPTPKWGAYLRGVFAEFATTAGCSEIPPVTGMVHATLPAGAGLSSSAALTMTTTLLLEQLTETALDDWQKILLCQRAEQAYAGVPCGFMDPFASLMGQEDCLLRLDCRDRSWQALPIVDSRVGFLVVNSMVRHALGDGAYAARRQQCEAAATKLGLANLREASAAGIAAERERLTPVEYRRARHVISENQRTEAAVAAVAAGDWSSLGQLLFATHASLRDDFEVSTSELDLLVDLARGRGEQGGVFGARLVGGGFGGCVLVLLDRAQQDQVAVFLADGYQGATGVAPKILAVRPSAGASAVAL